MDKDQIIEAYARQVADLAALVQALKESNAALNETIKELQETIRELQRRLNQNSQNSSRPPSTDGFNKPKPQSQRQKSGKKQGARKGIQVPTWLFRTNPMITAGIFRKSVFHVST